MNSAGQSVSASANHTRAYSSSFKVNMSYRKWHWMFPVVFIVHQVIWGWNSIVLLTSPSLNRQKGCLVYTWLSMLCLYIQVCVSTGVYVCSIYTVCASNCVETCWQVLTLKAVWKFRVVQKNKRVLSRSEDVSLPVKSSGCSRVRTLSFVLRSSSQVQKNTRDLSCSLWSLGRCLGPAGGRSRRGRWTLWWRRCGRPSAPTPSLWGHPGEPRPRPPRTWWCLVVWRRCRFQKEPTQTVCRFFVWTHTLFLCSRCRAHDVVVWLAVCHNNEEVAARSRSPGGENVHEQNRLGPPDKLQPLQLLSSRLPSVWRCFSSEKY